MAILIPNFTLAQKIGQQVEIDAPSVRELIEEGTRRFGEDFKKAAGAATIAVNGRAINLLDGLKTRLEKDDQVWMILPAGGG